MDQSARDRFEAGIGPHLHQMLPIEQSAGDQLFVPKHFAVAHLCLQVAVGGGCHLQVFRTDATVEASPFQTFECCGHGAFDTDATFTQLERLTATHLDGQHIHRWAADELGHKQV